MSKLTGEDTICNGSWQHRPWLSIHLLTKSMKQKEKLSSHLLMKSFSQDDPFSLAYLSWIYDVHNLLLWLCFIELITTKRTKDTIINTLIPKSLLTNWAHSENHLESKNTQRWKQVNDIFHDNNSSSIVVAMIITIIIILMNYWDWQLYLIPCRCSNEGMLFLKMLKIIARRLRTLYFNMY